MSFIETNTIVHLERVPTKARESARITAPPTDAETRIWLCCNTLTHTPGRSRTSRLRQKVGGSNLFGRAPRKMGSARWQRARLSGSRGCQLKPARMGRIRQMLSERDERGHAPWSGLL